MSDEREEIGPETESGSEAELLRHRRENFERVTAHNDPYPFSYPATATVQEIVARYERTSGEDLEREPVTEAAAGRVLAKRVQGKAGFLDLSDGRARLQVYVRRDAVG